MTAREIDSLFSITHNLQKQCSESFDRDMKLDARIDALETKMNASDRRVGPKDRRVEFDGYGSERRRVLLLSVYGRRAGDTTPWWYLPHKIVSGSSQEIEVTEGMITAGFNAYMEWSGSPVAIVPASTIYRAMESARRKEKGAADALEKASNRSRRVDDLIAGVAHRRAGEMHDYSHRRTGSVPQSPVVFGAKKRWVHHREGEIRGHAMLRTHRRKDDAE